jgi:polyisoprenoid-binding protein YceI
VLAETSTAQPAWRTRIQLNTCDLIPALLKGAGKRNKTHEEDGVPMKRVIWLGLLTMLIAVPSWLAAQEGRGDYDHGSVGIFADYFRFSPTSSNTTNFVGFGARTGFNVNRFAQIEAEMNYDFERNFTSTFNNGVSTQFVTTRVRPLTGLFGPKFQTSGPFKFFVTGKVGFINFSKTNAAVTPGTVGNAISGVGNGGTHLAVYPGAGFEGF